MRDYSYSKVTLRKSQPKGSRTQSMGAPLSHFLFKAGRDMKLECRRGISPTPLDMRGIFSFFSPFFKSPGAGRLAFPPVHITSAIFIPLLTAMPAPPAPGKIIWLPLYFSKKKEGEDKWQGSKNTYLLRNYLI